MHPPARVPITHPDRLVFPDLGITKGDVVAYYDAVMSRFLPGVAGRPTSVKRYPEGIGKEGFFQKHPMPGLKHVGSVRLREESGALADYLCPRNASAIIELVQFGTIEFHPWAARERSLEEVDYLVFDLDPAPELAWSEVTEAARHVRGRLADVGLRSFVRTTGGKGLHVLAPLHSGCSWEEAMGFSRGFAQRLAAEQPQSFVAKATKRERTGRIFIDYLRNSRGATSVASYSLRARAGAPVAMPLRWQELGKCEHGAMFGIVAARRRVTRLRSDPWEGFASLQQALRKNVWNDDNAAP
ncbi:DNA polymerase domain-containing protein [Dyella solisilvae]|uniref:DNA polymerase domain-containing protein n=1 Tax=Dyella solisilvae TaxID=1920168 RepID=A0A370KA15_9GAMM|nr:non-homologous end-joining DNA ligase [Dyella solisilvae]RDI99488.1 DNA polymerase domain-containing protein [Dyella solisilvae]